MPDEEYKGGWQDEVKMEDLEESEGNVEEGEESDASLTRSELVEDREERLAAWYQCGPEDREFISSIPG